MDTGTISLILLLGILGLLAIGMPLGFASAFLAVLVMVLKFGPDLLFSSFGTGPLNIIAQRVYGLLTDYVLISIPLFIFMANLLERSGIAHDMYTSLNAWLSRVRGGIAIVTSIMATIMAAMSGIIGGEVVLLGLIALPQMLRLGYNQNFACGVICTSGSLGTMIPPSIVLIIYGLITETSIKALFTAAFLPGFMLSAFIIAYIVIRTQMRPQDAPLQNPAAGDPVGREKSMLLFDFLMMLTAGFAALLFARALFLTLSGQNVVREGVAPIVLGQPEVMPWLGGIAVAAAVIVVLLGAEKRAQAWAMGKGLVAPLIVIGVVLGSIYTGIATATEAAALGVAGSLVIAACERSLDWRVFKAGLV
ncbi:MAG TPA: TRAP transporter large permease subunit, partial [Paracoccaceae bacterium]|nr:TRAP transporter large permease subunit [Paracoccaceae bacterium]